jgi:dTDP-4-amino-4,6-dideoxygalactose transaminase
MENINIIRDNIISKVILERQDSLKPFNEPINVTKPFLPPLEEYSNGLKEVWENKWLTNNGPILKRFNKELSDYFETDNICLFNNGTLALQIALQGMGISGEVITTPFSFVATSHALIWNNIKPVFADIKPDYYTLNPENVEAVITPQTTAILAVHVYGYPCDHAALQSIAEKHNIKLLYDAAHAFGTKIGDKSIAHYGDASMFSFHSTKLFHSIEGGMLVFPDDHFKNIFDYLKNFGFKNEIEVVMPGTNAKMNEMQALMGSQVLKYIDQIIEKRSKITYLYRDCLKDINGIILPPPLPELIRNNYAYFPIEVEEREFGISRDSLYEKLKKFNIFCRRYFYPLICDFMCYKSSQVKDPLTVARKVASRILTLPIYDALDLKDVEIICNIIKEIQLRNI